MQRLHKAVADHHLLSQLSSDCNNCWGLCCKAFYFSKSDGFPKDKKAGIPCDYLTENDQCSIHNELVNRKLKGCLAYDCMGSGQKVTRQIYPHITQRTFDQSSEEIFKVFLKVQQLHQILWYLMEAQMITGWGALEKDIKALVLEIESASLLSSDKLLAANIDEYREKANPVIKKTGQIISEQYHPKHSLRKKTDYFGCNFKKKDLSGMDFSMSVLIAANLEDCLLYGTNFIGADMRDANLKSADLRNSIFLTQRQINSAVGNSKTMLPDTLVYPSHWLN